jgi:hypothetical protein
MMPGVQGNFTAAINAQNLLLKVGGLIVDRREVLHGKVDQMSRGEVERRLADLLGKNAIEHKSGVELPLKSGSGDIEIGEIVEEKIVKKKSGRVRPIPKERSRRKIKVCIRYEGSCVCLNRCIQFYRGNT